MSKLPLCVYHSADLDGKCSAEVVRRALGEVDLYPMDYGKPFDWGMVEDRSLVVMVDFSLEPFTEMDKLYDLLGNDRFVWIDHHKTAIAEYDARRICSEPGKPCLHDLSWRGLREVGKAGCELAWAYFSQGSPPPVGLWLLGRYDVWDHSDSRTLPFQYAMREVENLPGAPVWDKVFDEEFGFLHNMVSRGETILSYERRQNEAYAKARCFLTKLGEHTVLACNRGLANSQLFDSVWDPEEAEAMAAFCLTPKGRWKVQLYTTRADVDVSEIAKMHGGGGHRGAAGFDCDSLPFALGGPRPKKAERP